MNIDLNKVTMAFIGQIPEDNFVVLKKNVPELASKTLQQEYQEFEGPFLKACAERRTGVTLKIPAWRRFDVYQFGNDGAFHFLHPHASETAFPAKKALFGNRRIAAAECCDGRIDRDGKITTTNISVVAAIYDDGRVFAVQPICKDTKAVNNPSISNGAQNPFTLNFLPPTQLIPYFTEARRRGGSHVTQLLQTPSYFPGGVR